MSSYFFKIAMLALALSLISCAQIETPNAKSTTGRAATVAEVPSPDETVRGEEDPPIVVLEVGSKLHEHKLAHTDQLPANIIVPTTNLSAVPVTTALQAVLSGTDISLSWDTKNFEDTLVTVTNLSGPLPKVVDKICGSAKIFCNNRHGLLELKTKETFAVELPSAPSKPAAGGATGTAATNTMADEISDLAGDKAKVDSQGGNIVYTTDVEGQEAVHEYLINLRNGRPMVILQLYIWNVTLTKANSTGINFTNFKLPKVGGPLQNLIASGSTAFTNVSQPGVTLNAALSGKVDASTVLGFLATQGDVQTISNPQMTFISGGNAELKVGGKTRYISQIGQLVSSNVSGSGATGSSSVGQNTVSTDSVDTGLTVDVNGAYENGVITASLDLAINDVTSLNPTTTGGQTIDLPVTSEQKVSSNIRVRPGDNLLLAGLVTSRDTTSREGIPLPFGGRLPTFSNDNITNTELVILVKPSVVLFSDANQRAEEERKEKASQPKPLPEPIMIDKSGTQTITMPKEAPAQPTSLQPTTTNLSAATIAASTATPPPLPELMVNDPTATPVRDTPIAPSQDGAPVDRRLLQRGFSHAFDDLLVPDTKIQKAGGGTQ